MKHFAAAFVFFVGFCSNSAFSWPLQLFERNGAGKPVQHPDGFLVVSGNNGDGLSGGALFISKSGEVLGRVSTRFPVLSSAIVTQGETALALSHSIIQVIKGSGALTQEFAIDQDWGEIHDLAYVDGDLIIAKINGRQGQPAVARLYHLTTKDGSIHKIDEFPIIGRYPGFNIGLQVMRDGTIVIGSAAVKSVGSAAVISGYARLVSLSTGKVREFTPKVGQKECDILGSTAKNIAVIRCWRKGDSTTYFVNSDAEVIHAVQNAPIGDRAVVSEDGTRVAVIGGELLGRHVEFFDADGKLTVKTPNFTDGDPIVFLDRFFKSGKFPLRYYEKMADGGYNDILAIMDVTGKIVAKTIYNDEQFKETRTYSESKGDDLIFFIANGKPGSIWEVFGVDDGGEIRIRLKDRQYFGHQVLVDGENRQAFAVFEDLEKLFLQRLTW